MQTTELHSTLEDEYQKQLHSLKLKRFFQQRKVKNNTHLLVVISIICLVVAAFNSFLWVYFAMIVFWWVMFVVSNVMDETSLDRSARRLRKNVDAYFDPSFRATVVFGDEGVSLTVNKPKEETVTLNWKHFIGYNDSGEVLLLAATNKAGICFTRNEMGQEAFNDLKQLAATKLPTLKDYYAEEKDWWRIIIERLQK